MLQNSGNSAGLQANASQPTQIDGKTDRFATHMTYRATVRVQGQDKCAALQDNLQHFSGK